MKCNEENYKEGCHKDDTNKFYKKFECVSKLHDSFKEKQIGKS